MGVLGARRSSTSFDNSEHVSGPHAVLVVNGPDHRPENGRTQFPALPLNFPPFARPYDFVAPRWATKHRANSPVLMTCRHLEYGVHADASRLFSQPDQKPCLNQAECKRAAGRGLSGGGQHGESARAATSSWVSPSVARPPFIDTKLFVISIESFLHDAAVLVNPHSWRQMAVALKQPS